MSRMKLHKSEDISSYDDKLEHWTSRELQLNVLHAEIIHKREALLGMSRNLLQSMAQEEPQLNNTEAFVRNDMLMKDVEGMEDYIAIKQQAPVNSRFANLQANYKSMVENMFPIWQKSLQEKQAGPDRAIRKDI